MMKKLFCTLVLILTLVSCSNNELPSGKRAGGFSLKDPAKHKIVLELMEERGIPYEINERGFVIYLLKNQAEVHGIIRKVRDGDVLDEAIFEGAVLTDQLTRDKYEAAFKEAGIPYTISDHKGVTQINWSQKYGPKVDVLRQKIDEEIMDIVINNAQLVK